MVVNGLFGVKDFVLIVFRIDLGEYEEFSVGGVMIGG